VKKERNINFFQEKRNMNFFRPIKVAANLMVLLSCFLKNTSAVSVILVTP
jgi:hypothetical protein